MPRPGMQLRGEPSNHHAILRQSESSCVRFCEIYRDTATSPRRPMYHASTCLVELMHRMSTKPEMGGTFAVYQAQRRRIARTRGRVNLVAARAGRAAARRDELSAAHERPERTKAWCSAAGAHAWTPGAPDQLPRDTSSDQVQGAAAAVRWQGPTSAMPMRAVLDKTAGAWALLRPLSGHRRAR